MMQLTIIAMIGIGGSVNTYAFAQMEIDETEGDDVQRVLVSNMR